MNRAGYESESVMTRSQRGLQLPLCLRLGIRSSLRARVCRGVTTKQPGYE